MSVAYMFKGRVAITTLPLNICRLFFIQLSSRPSQALTTTTFRNPRGMGVAHATRDYLLLMLSNFILRYSGSNPTLPCAGSLHSVFSPYPVQHRTIRRPLQGTA